MVKDVAEYYKKVTKDYENMKEELRDMEQLCKEKVVAPEQLEQMKLMVEPIKLNYETLSYFMFLLNKPCKKSKLPRYETQNKKLGKESKNRKASDLLEENQKALDGLKELREEISND